MLVTASIVPSSSETSVLTRATRRTIPEDTILHSHRRENLKSYLPLHSRNLHAGPLYSVNRQLIPNSCSDRFVCQTPRTWTHFRPTKPMYVNKMPIGISVVKCKPVTAQTQRWESLLPYCHDWYKRNEVHVPAGRRNEYSCLLVFNSKGNFGGKITQGAWNHGNIYWMDFLIQIYIGF
jgi:hypothetical protein